MWPALAEPHCCPTSTADRSSSIGAPIPLGERPHPSGPQLQTYPETPVLPRADCETLGRSQYTASPSSVTE
jgi:hypothetical protein